MSLTNLSYIKTGKSRKNTVYNVPAVFDIETTSFFNQDGEKQSCMYAWVFGVNGRCVRGRTWQELHRLLAKVTEILHLSETTNLIVYVHNLAYEFQFMRHQFQWSKVFALDSRKPVYAQTTTGILFKCSYILSGYSLELVGKNLTKYQVEKAVGDLDYRKLRHSQTHLTETEWGYILNDGLVVMAYIQEEIERLGGIHKIPLTKTGYVREYTKGLCFNDKRTRYRYRELIKRLTLDPDSYKQLKRAFSGGFTHANYHHANKVLHSVHSYDFTSSYPAVMLSEQFPMSTPRRATLQSRQQFDYALENLCCVFTVTFTNIVSTAEYDNYISFSRCLEVNNPIINNGRIVEADSLTITVTEQDYKLIRSMYEWDTEQITDFYYMYKDYLPKPMIEAICYLYKDKTELKGVEGKESEYLVSKGMLNSLYGMCVTDICRDTDEYVNDIWTCSYPDVEEVIAKYNKNPVRFLYYAWGVWVTAYARRNLFQGIQEFGMDYVYSDTDSIKVLNPDQHQEFFKAYNQEITQKVYRTLDHYQMSRDYANPKTIKGVPKPIGVWDYEGVYERFKTLGAKRYMYTQDNKLHITIAGVGKKAGAEYLLHTFNTIDNVFDNFVDGMEFPAEYEVDGVICNGSGKLTHTYLDYHMQGELTDYLGNTAMYNELSGIFLENTAYSLSLEQYYKDLIEGATYD